MDDAELVRQVCEAADGRAYAALVRRHQGPLRAWLRRLLNGDVQLADELAQETFLRAYRSLATWRGEAAFRSWLIRIALSAWHDQLRRPSVWSVPAQDASSPSEVAAPREDAASEAGVADDPAEQVARRLDIDRALSRLSPAQRAVVVHACWGDLSQSEISEVMGLPLGTVKTHHRRAMAILAQALEDLA